MRLEIAKGCVVDTIGYNGAVPAPLIRVREGAPLNIELVNETDHPEFVHWHGLICPADVDGAEEEGSPSVPARGTLRYQLVPKPAGARFIHSHSMSMGDLNRSTYSGQFGFMYIEPASIPGRYDQKCSSPRMSGSRISP